MTILTMAVLTLLLTVTLVLDKADRIPEAVTEGRPDYALEAEPLIKADERP